MMVDAAFVIEILLKLCGHCFNPLGVDDHDNISSKSWIINYIMPNMLKLENQVLFCILEDLLELQRIAAVAISNISYVIPSMMNLAFEFINMAFSLTSMVQNVGMLGGEVKAVSAPSISELQMAGVKIVWESSTSLSAIRFVDRILEIPRLLIHNGSELLFRNIAAFEQCHGCSSYVNNYLSILNDFVNVPMDVELLIKKGIFINMLTDHNEVSTLINDLGKGVVISDFYFGSVCEELDCYLKRPWIKWKSTLKRHFFNSPWATNEITTFACRKDYGIGANFSSIQWKWVPRQANKTTHDQSERGLHVGVIIRSVSSWANEGLPSSSRKSLGRPIVGYGLGLGLVV
ncbi:unnamed protein product [Prunus armeniaca]